MPRSEGNGATSVAVLGKAMALIDRIAEVGAATPAQLAELTGEPRSTVYRLLANLQQLELVEPGPRRGTFVLGLKLFRLGRTVASRFDERQAALPVMERIHDELGETMFLCVRRGYDAVCIERIDGTRVNLLALSLGGSLPLHAGGASRALLAFEPEAFWDEYLEQRDARGADGSHAGHARGAARGAACHAGARLLRLRPGRHARHRRVRRADLRSHRRGARVAVPRRAARAPV